MPKRPRVSSAQSTKRQNDEASRPALHQVQVDVAERVKNTLTKYKAAYLIGEPGVGKTTLIPALLEPCAENTILHIVAAPSAGIIQETKRKLTFTIAPPFNSGQIEVLRKHVQGAMPGTILTIGVTRMIFFAGSSTLRGTIHTTLLISS